MLERWSKDVTLGNSENEVIVDPLCATAVLRGAHVFAPGVMGLPTSKTNFLIILSIESENS